MKNMNSIKKLIFVLLILSFAKVYSMPGNNNSRFLNNNTAAAFFLGDPKDYKLMQNSPNPFNPTTSIKFQLPQNTFVTLKVYNLIGREVATLVNEERAAGTHVVYWNGKDSNGMSLASGVYLYKLIAGSYVEIRKMNLLK